MDDPDGGDEVMDERIGGQVAGRGRRVAPPLIRRTRGAGRRTPPGQRDPAGSNLTIAEATRPKIDAFGIEYEGKTGLSTFEFARAA